jgi:hypothetical protein
MIIFFIRSPLDNHQAIARNGDHAGKLGSVSRHLGLCPIISPVQDVHPVTPH